ncbi:unnamed protein product [Nyctereutes procyonoides]|uniref:(raccoon dog) hypothetical protein n=1 Tax=Nyctereutes procyonoides TaxID=34880 RepID=A0A811Z223_NYCPR|nr:unnamed protein product [Nyctereutes procyonoides]
MQKTFAENANFTFEDQQKINKFSWNTSRITELKEEIVVKKRQLQNLEMLLRTSCLQIDDYCLMIPYQIGDKNFQEETDALESKVESIQQVLVYLKVQLYAKFGSKINLESNES